MQQRGHGGPVTGAGGGHEVLEGGGLLQSGQRLAERNGLARLGFERLIREVLGDFDAFAGKVEEIDQVLITDQIGGEVVDLLVQPALFFRGNLGEAGAGGKKLFPGGGQLFIGILVAAFVVGIQADLEEGFAVFDIEDGITVGHFREEEDIEEPGDRRNGAGGFVLQLQPDRGDGPVPQQLIIGEGMQGLGAAIVGLGHAVHDFEDLRLPGRGQLARREDAGRIGDAGLAGEVKRTGDDRERQEDAEENRCFFHGFRRLKG